VLNLARNYLGELVLPEGWTDNRRTGCQSGAQFTHADGRKQPTHPGKPEGVITLANVVPNMGALTSLNLADNRLCGNRTNEYGALQGTFDLSGMFSVHASFNDN
jgi:hypothetical protein